MKLELLLLRLIINNTVFPMVFNEETLRNSFPDSTPPGRQVKLQASVHRFAPTET